MPLTAKSQGTLCLYLKYPEVPNTSSPTSPTPPSSSPTSRVSSTDTPSTSANPVQIRGHIGHIHHVDPTTGEATIFLSTTKTLTVSSGTQPRVSQTRPHPSSSSRGRLQRPPGKPQLHSPRRRPPTRAPPQGASSTHTPPPLASPSSPPLLASSHAPPNALSITEWVAFNGLHMADGLGSSLPNLQDSLSSPHPPEGASPKDSGEPGVEHLVRLADSPFGGANEESSTRNARARTPSTSPHPPSVYSALGGTAVLAICQQCSAGCEVVAQQVSWSTFSFPLGSHSEPG
ncbi:hypothetical protein BDK51DRAFT_45661 [Blyttiomyces helicus]|uniref:Uncharacterized protein n=1 Tax=Blyttiomyces helicus TaxID=388810 RepID=A0A4P9WHR7_9FUNG|nr:hypothetical protein BDK51DRAFT_45661 [Blyttiomyces helicus]|eukprot:RKO92381.1 hypothetical protein BDK51DRAFT_45661 [Blyttiomyces helicus]